MSHKSAKTLRKLMGYHPSQPRDYKDTVVKTVAVPAGRLNENGSEQMRFESRIIRTNVGKRAAYQTGKRYF